ncbi:STAS domain-containing protein [Iodobacter sp. CM08]|uniref:STAS domain-containing protein n=1 Tax=Iodobacter sp. CM08 TaxID=3085902 RepID=UPI002981C95B|nr:STAS domain-containing protein [Iodobacter sp. CM08]MDW5415446.1 STAS domain-containing protein [Iodobacter sp. CM08]
MKVFQASGKLTLDTAAAQLTTLPTLSQGELLEVNLSQISAADSSAVAVLLHWLRNARKQGAELCFSELTEGLAGLIRLYGVSTILPLK